MITGRGAGSIGGVPVVKERTMRVLSRLRRLGVVQGYAEDTPGSFVVMLAPLRSLLEAPARRKASTTSVSRRTPDIAGLKTKTRDRLSYLAERSLSALGLRNPSADQVTDEMQRQFSIIVRSAAPNVDTDWWLEHAIGRALGEYADSDR